MLKKQYVKSKGKYKVTFRLAKHELPDYEVETAHLVGDFNDWGGEDKMNTPMKQLKKGDFQSKSLPGTRTKI